MVQGSLPEQPYNERHGRGARAYLALSGAAGAMGGVTSSRVSAALGPPEVTSGASSREESSARRCCAGAAGGSGGGAAAAACCWRASLPAAAAATDRCLCAVLGRQGWQGALASAAIAEVAGARLASRDCAAGVTTRMPGLLCNQSLVAACHVTALAPQWAPLRRSKPGRNLSERQKTRTSFCLLWGLRCRRNSDATRRKLSLCAAAV